MPRDYTGGHKFGKGVGREEELFKTCEDRANLPYLSGSPKSNLSFQMRCIS